MNNIRSLIIIGSGPAGLTAGVYAARANLNPMIIAGNKPGGQLMTTTAVENWPGEQSILGPTLMMNMDKHARYFGTEIISDIVITSNLSKTPFSLQTEKNGTFQAHAIIIATGASPRRLNCPGEELYWGKGVTTCAVCDGAFYKDKAVVIVGGGDSAMETASFLRNFTKNITIVQIEKQLTASYIMQQRIIHDPHITILYEQTITEIVGDGTHVTSVTITHRNQKTTKTIPCDGLFLAIGFTPNSKPFLPYVQCDSHGYIKLVKQQETSIPGIFAAGDIHDYRYRQAITAAGEGCKAALDAERYLKNRYTAEQ